MISNVHEDKFGSYAATIQISDQIYRVTRSKGENVRIAYSNRRGWQWWGTVYLNNKVVWHGRVPKGAKAQAIFNHFQRDEEK